MCDHLCTAEFFITRSRDTQANLHIVCSSHTWEPTIFRADEARTMRNRLGQMLNTSIRVWSSFCCKLTPSALVRVILSVNYSIAWVKIRCKSLQRWKQYKKRLRHNEHCYRPYMCEEKNSLTGETYSTAEVSVHQVNVITYNTTSCPSVAITLKGLAGLEHRTTKFSLSRMYFHSSLMPKVCRLLSISFYKLNTKIQLKTSPLYPANELRTPVLSIPEEQSTKLRSDNHSL